MLKSDLDTLTLNEYRVRVQNAARQPDAEPIFNGTPDHAEIILTNLWASAENKVQLISRCFEESVYNSDELIDAAQSFLSRPNTEAEILYEVEPELSNRFFAAISKFDKVKFIPVSEQDRARYDFSFMVADDKNYRYAEDKLEMSAIAAFGDAPNAKHLSNIFDEIVDIVTPEPEKITI